MQCVNRCKQMVKISITLLWSFAFLSVKLTNKKRVEQDCLLDNIPPYLWLSTAKLKENPHFRVEWWKRAQYFPENSISFKWCYIFETIWVFGSVISGWHGMDKSTCHCILHGSLTHVSVNPITYHKITVKMCSERSTIFV